MSSKEEPKPIRRILVALDASPHSLASLEMAAAMAEKFDAELVGIYIEDINLIRLARLPITREVGFYSASLRQVELTHVERQLRAQARTARRALALIVEGTQVPWTFRVARGAINTELLTAALDADLLILGKVGWSGRRQIGSTAQVAVIQSPHHTMIYQRGVDLQRPILIIYDGSITGELALATANQLKTEESLVTVLIVADVPERAETLKHDVMRWSQNHDLEPRFLWLSRIDGELIARLAWSEGFGLVVLPAESGSLSDETLLRLVDRADCAVLIIR